MDPTRYVRGRIANRLALVPLGGVLAGCAPDSAASTSGGGSSSAVDPATAAPTTQRRDDQAAGDDDPDRDPPKVTTARPPDDALSDDGPPPEPILDRPDRDVDLRMPSCPSVTWCGTVTQAAKIAAKDRAGHGQAKAAGCPAAVDIRGEIPKGEAYEVLRAGLWGGAALPDAERPPGTAADACCYSFTQPCPGGRPLATEGGVVAPAVCGLGSRAAAADPADPAGALRAALAAGWARDAANEWISVASFARATLELMGLGAPDALVEAYQRASLDEVAHARGCAALAARFSGQPAILGAVPATGPRPGDLGDLVRRTIVEACLPETGAAVAAGLAAERCHDADSRALLEMIARDEAEHAALAFQTVQWALAREPAAAAAALRAGVAELDAALARAASDPLAIAGHAPPALPDRPDAAGLASWGRLSPAQLASIEARGWHELVRPTLLALLGAAAETGLT